MMLNIQDLQPCQDWILQDNNDFLSIKCKDVTFPLDKNDTMLVNRMVNYIDASYQCLAEKYKIREGIAIAAPQVGCDKKIIYLHFCDGVEEHHYLLANPKIVATSIQKCYLGSGEGCLSVKKDHPGHVARYAKIRVQALDMLNDNKPITINADGLFAVCLQHEIDHLSGILYYHHIDENHKYLDDDETLIRY